MSEPQEEKQSRTNMNVGNQERLDKDYYENSHDKDSAGGPGAEAQEVTTNCKV